MTGQAPFYLYTRLPFVCTCAPQVRVNFSHRPMDLLKLELSRKRAALKEKGLGKVCVVSVHPCLI